MNGALLTYTTIAVIISLVYSEKPPSRYMVITQVLVFVIQLIKIFLFPLLYLYGFFLITTRNGNLKILIYTPTAYLLAYTRGIWKMTIYITGTSAQQ